MSEARTQEDLAYLSATEQLELFRRREISPVEVLQAQIARADALAESVNALTWRFNERALEQAKAAEARYLGKGDAPRALEGITLAIKEEMGVAGDPVTSASLAYKDAIAEQTAPLAERAIAAGAIVHARTTQPEFACAVFTQSKMFGITPGTRTSMSAAAPAALAPASRPGSRPWPAAPTSAAPSAFLPRARALWASSRPTAACRSNRPSTLTTTVTKGR
jgi:hypothetical protein